MPKTTIEVTVRDIKCGERGSPGFCPIALAFREQWGTDEHDEIDVDRIDITLTDGNGERKFWARLPDVATRFIEDFDAGRSVKPFKFDLTYRHRRGA